MKRVLLVAIMAAALLSVGAVVVLAGPGAPGWGSGMMGRPQSGAGSYGHMGTNDHMGGWTMPGSGMMSQGGGYGMMGEGDMMHDDLEELLGISHADLHAAMVDGRSLVEIAAEKGVTETKLTETLLAGRKAALDRALENGSLTRAAADRMVELMAANITAMVNAKGMSGMMGLPGIEGMRGMQGMMGQQDHGMMGGNGNAPCHDGESEQGSNIRSPMRFLPSWLHQS